MRHALIVAAAVLGLHACQREPEGGGPNGKAQPGSGKAEAPLDQALQLRRSPDGAPSTVPVGREFEVQLSDNITVNPPRVWQVDELPDNVRSLGRRYASQGDGEGAGSSVAFRFVAASPGRGRLRFVTESGEDSLDYDLIAE